MILLSEVCKKFNCGSSWEQLFNPLEVRAIDNLSFEHPGGECLYITGPAGAGKSVLVNLLAGLYRPDSGEVRIFSKDPVESSSLRKKIGLVRPEKNRFDSTLSPRRNLRLLAGWYGISGREQERRVEESLDYVQIDAGARDTRLGELSPGTINQVNLAGGLICSPELLLLDEPDKFMAPSARGQLKKLLQGLQQQGMTLILASTETLLIEGLEHRKLKLAEGRKVSYG